MLTNQPETLGDEWVDWLVRIAMTKLERAPNANGYFETVAIEISMAPFSSKRLAFDDAIFYNVVVAIGTNRLIHDHTGVGAFILGRYRLLLHRNEARVAERRTNTPVRHIDARSTRSIGTVLIVIGRTTERTASYRHERHNHRDGCEAANGGNHVGLQS